MANKSKQEIIDDIESHIKKRGGEYSDWYVGISKDVRDRLFIDHNVKEKKDSWIFRRADSSQTAREIEDYFLSAHGTDGGPGGGDDTSVKVYAYKKAKHTNP